MAKDRLSDKLAVILHADVADSTALVQQDEHLAHERIQEAFRRFSGSIEKYRGRILELRGDALLAEFERASDAITAALAFQTDHTYYLSRLKDEMKPSVEGKRFWSQGAPWGRHQGLDGSVEYTGFEIQPGIPKSMVGSSRVEDDMLCERWPNDPRPLELCSLIFRLPETNARTRWGDYVLVTDTGPNSFNVAQ